MEGNFEDDRGVSESMWQDFSEEMDSSTFGMMERFALETRRMDEEMIETEEIPSGNEAEIPEAIYMNEVIVSAVREDFTGVNEVVISEVIDENTSVNEDVIEEAIKRCEEVIEEAINGSEEVIEEAINGSEEETSICRQEINSPTEKEPCVKMRHFLSDEQYFFVEDLIESVKETQIEVKENSPEPKRRKRKRPSPCSFYFSAEHSYFAQKYVYSQQEDFISLIEESTPTSDTCVFETCKERFIERYKPKTYTEKGFVDFCAAIAYLGIHCSTRGLDPSAEIKATNYICSLLYDVLQRGTLEKSSWQKSEYFQL